MPYSIPLTNAGKHYYEQRDRDVERAVIFLVDRIGEENWAKRRKLLLSRYAARLKPDPKSTPPEGISVRDREDEIGWYIHLAEASISDPVATDSDQASRALPYLSAFGRKLDAILAIEGASARIERFIRLLPNQDPDQALFELFVGAAYVEEGWAVAFIPRRSTKNS